MSYDTAGRTGGIDTNVLETQIRICTFVVNVVNRGVTDTICEGWVADIWFQDTHLPAGKMTDYNIFDMFSSPVTWTWTCHTWDCGKMFSIGTKPCPMINTHIHQAWYVVGWWWLNCWLCVLLFVCRFWPRVCTGGGPNVFPVPVGMWHHPKPSQI